MSPGVSILSANTTGGYHLPASCTAGQAQVTATGFFFCGTSGWMQLPGLTGGKLSTSVIPDINLLSGTISTSQLPGTITSNTSGNAATATALAATPTQAPTGRFCIGIAANGNCIPAQVQWSQIGAAPAFVLSSSVGQSGGVAALDNSGKIPAGQIPSLSYTTLSDLPALGSAASIRHRTSSRPRPSSLTICLS
jgi:hypothetical protein